MDVARTGIIFHSGRVEIEDAQRALNQAQQILAHSANYQPEEWMLLATLVGEADLAIRQTSDASAELRSLRDRVVGEFRDITDGFTKPEFVQASGPVRRRNKELFSDRP